MRLKCPKCETINEPYLINDIAPPIYNYQCVCNCLYSHREEGKFFSNAQILQNEMAVSELKGVFLINSNSVKYDTVYTIGTIESKEEKYKKALLKIRATCPADGLDSAWAIATEALYD